MKSLLKEEHTLQTPKLVGHNKTIDSLRKLSTDRLPAQRPSSTHERRSGQRRNKASRFTVMVVPHGGDKGISFALSLPSIVFLGLLVAGLLVGTIYLAGTNKDFDNQAADNSRILERTQANLDEVTDEVSNLLRVYRMMDTALKDSLRASSVAPGTSEGESLGFEHFSSDGAANLEELTKALNSAIGPMGELSQTLRSQRQLLTDIPNVWPVGGPSGLTMEFGPNLHPLFKYWYIHKGIDIAGSTGLPVVASASGRVTRTGYDSVSGYGYYVDVEHKYGFKTKYAHLGSISVREGQEVVQGQRLGALGSTGLSTGAHVHFEIILGTQVLDPVSFLKISNTFARWEGDRGPSDSYR